MAISNRCTTSTPAAWTTLMASEHWRKRRYSRSAGAAATPGRIRQAARFGPFGRVRGQEQGGLLLVLDPAQDGGQFAQGQGATAVGRLDDGRQARGVQIIDRAIIFPRTNRRIGPFDPRLAQAQARRARGGLEGEVEQDAGAGHRP